VRCSREGLSRRLTVHHAGGTDSMGRATDGSRDDPREPLASRSRTGARLREACRVLPNCCGSSLQLSTSARTDRSRCRGSSRTEFRRPCEGPVVNQFGPLGVKRFSYARKLRLAWVIHLWSTGNMCLIGSMSQIRNLGAGLTALAQPNNLRVSFPEGRSGLSFDRVPGRISSSLVFGANGLRVDVSFQPGAVVCEIGLSARELGADPNRWSGAILSVLREWSGELDWCAQDPSQLLAAVGALTHPLLAHVYERGRQPLSAVPRWALSVLRCNEPMDAARALAGDGANRRLARALAESLLGDGEHSVTQLGPLGFACVATGLVSVDELANILEIPGRVGHDRWPSVDEVRVARQGLQLLPPTRRAALLLDSARCHDAKILSEVMTRLLWVRDQVERPLPMKLDELKAVCNRLVPTFTPVAAMQPITPRRETRVVADIPRPVLRQPAQLAMHPVQTEQVVRPGAVPMRRPNPTSLTTGPNPTSWPIPTSLRRIHRHRCERFSFTIPTSAIELLAWGRQLRNCLADFAPAVSREQSWLIGIERDGDLIGCIEVQPDSRRIRQALGRSNSPLPPSVHDVATRALTECGVIPLVSGTFARC